MDIACLEQKAVQIRRQALELVYRAQTGHIGGTLSSVDYLVLLYYDQMRLNPKNYRWPERDRFILSKGHCVEAYLCILADLGFFPKEELLTFSQFGTRLIGHASKSVPGIEMNTGSLGHGLSAGCGMALAAKKLGKDWKVHVLLGDGELAEGSVWEAAMFASHYRLDNLYAAVDRNHLQISGNTEDVMALEPLADKWTAFGFDVETVDGNHLASIKDAFARLETRRGKPKMLLLDTVKGKGVRFMENNPKWHHGALTKDQYELALAQLGEVAP